MLCTSVKSCEYEVVTVQMQRVVNPQKQQKYIFFTTVWLTTLIWSVKTKISTIHCPLSCLYITTEHLYELSPLFSESVNKESFSLKKKLYFLTYDHYLSHKLTQKYVGHHCCRYVYRYTCTVVSQLQITQCKHYKISYLPHSHIHTSQCYTQSYNMLYSTTSMSALSLHTDKICIKSHTICVHSFIKTPSC